MATRGGRNIMNFYYFFTRDKKTCKRKIVNDKIKHYKQI